MSSGQYGKSATEKPWRDLRLFGFPYKKVGQKFAKFGLVPYPCTVIETTQAMNEQELREQCRLAWKSRITGFSGAGEWFPIGQKHGLDETAKAANLKFHDIDHWVELSTTKTTLPYTQTKHPS